jgi:hypothetical protein
MRHECTRCGRVFQSIRSFDQHGRHCRKKRPPPLTIPLASENNTRLSSKRARVGSPDKGNSESDKDGLNVGGPDISVAHDSEPPAEADSRNSPSPPPMRSAQSERVVGIPRRLIDYVPHGDMSLAHVPPRAPTPPERDDRTASPVLKATSPHTRPHPFQTQPNKLGIFRQYTRNPTWHQGAHNPPSFVPPLPFTCKRST